MEKDNIDLRNRGLISKYQNASDINDKNELFVELVNINKGLIIDIANRFNSQEISFDDLLQEGYIALFNAVENFSLLSDVKFSSYAYTAMENAISRFVYDTKNQIRIPEYTAKILNSIQDEERKLKQELKRTPTNKEVASRLNMTEEDLIKYRNFGIQVLNITDEHVDGSNTILADLVDQQTKTPEDELIDNETREMVEEHFELLSDQEKDMLNRSFGLNGFKKQTNKEIGAFYHITGEAVRQRVQVALNKIKKSMNGE